MDKLIAIKIKRSDGTYSDQIPVNVLAEYVEWDNENSLIDVLGNIDLNNKGSVQDQLNQLYNNKANATALNTLEARVDNIVATSGSTEGNTELMDIRVGVGGVTYATAGNAVRGQIDEVNNNLDAITNSVVLYGWTDGAYIRNSSGTVDPTTPVEEPLLSYFILDCIEGDIFTIYGTGFSAGRLWSFIDQNGSILTVANANVTENGLIIKAPANSSKLVCNAATAQKHVIYKGAPLYKENRLSTVQALPRLEKTDVGEDDYIYFDLLNSIPFTSGKTLSLASFLNSDLYTYIDEAADLSTSALSDPIRVRDMDGSLINDILITYSPAIGSAIIAAGYTKEGAPDSRYRSSDVINGVLNLKDTTYFIVIQKFTNVPMIVKVKTQAYPVAYHVGVNQEFTTIHDCLVALKDDKNNKKIYIDGGTYDILEEMGGQQFLDSLTGSELWYEVCDIIPPNTELIGLGNVIIKMELPSTTSNEVATLLSPLNMMGSAKLKNLTVIGSNCRYCIHPEGEKKPEFNNAIWEIEDCYIEKTAVEIGTTTAIACGLNEGVFFKLKNNVIKSVGNSAFSMHDNSAIYSTSPRVVFDGCVLDALYYPIVFSCSYRENMQTIIRVMVVNCYAPKFMRKRTSQTYAKDCYKVTYINTPHRTQNAEEVTDLIPDDDYSNFN